MRYNLKPNLNNQSWVQKKHSSPKLVGCVRSCANMYILTTNVVKIYMFLCGF